MTSVRSQLKKLYNLTGDKRLKAALDALNEIRKPAGRPRREHLGYLLQIIEYRKGISARGLLRSACKEAAGQPFLIIDGKLEKLDANFETIRRLYYRAHKTFRAKN